MRNITINLVTIDETNGEWTLYLVEEGPWDDPELSSRLQFISERVHDAIEAVLCGAFAAKFPDSRGRDVRIQVDCHDDPPSAIEDLIRRLGESLSNSSEYQNEIHGSVFIRNLRIVSRAQLRRP